MNEYNQKNTITRKRVMLTEKGHHIEEEKVIATGRASNQRLISLFSLASELGFSISLPIIGGVLIGRWLDIRLNSVPRLTLSGLFVGLFIGGYALYHIIEVGLKKE